MTSKDIYRFYVYAYLRSSDSTTAKAGTPYYIGKGSGKRAWADHKRINLPSDPKNIVILETNLSEIGALAIERRLISWWGKKNNNSGILLNITDGGEGKSGVTTSEETKIKISIAKSGIPQTNEHRQSISIAKSGIPQTNEHRQSISESISLKMKDDSYRNKLSLARTGFKCSDTTKKNMSEARKKQPKGRVIYSILTGELRRISDTTPTPELHLNTKFAKNLYVIDGKYITPNVNIVNRYYPNLTISQIIKWANNIPSVFTTETLSKCTVLPIANYNHSELKNLLIQYQWVGL